MHSQWGNVKKRSLKIFWPQIIFSMQQTASLIRLVQGKHLYSFFQYNNYRSFTFMRAPIGPGVSNNLVDQNGKWERSGQKPWNWWKIARIPILCMVRGQTDDERCEGGTWEVPGGNFLCVAPNVRYTGLLHRKKFRNQVKNS